MGRTNAVLQTPLKKFTVALFVHKNLTLPADLMPRIRQMKHIVQASSNKRAFFQRGAPTLSIPELIPKT